MSVERHVLAALLKDREAYNLLLPIIVEDDFSIQGQIVYKYIQEYYSRDEEAKEIDKELLLSKIERKHEKHSSMFRELFDELEDCSVANVLHEFLELKKRKCANELSSILLNGEEKEISLKMQEYQELLDTTELTEEDDSIIYQPDLKILFAEQDRGEKIKVLPGRLNDILKGGIRRGHHIIIFAVVEIGKTLFTINFVYGFCKEGYKVLYLGNEEPIDDILDRCLSRFTGIDIDKVRENPAETQRLANEKGFNNLILIKSHAGSTAEIEKLVQEHKPDVLLVDQIKNLDIPGANDEMSTVIKASRFMRKMGKKYNLVPVSVTQAGDSASGKTVLQIRDIYFSKTSVAGDADLMIGIGCNEQMITQNRRIINLPKNKISGDHCYFPVEFDVRHNRVISL